MKTLKYYAVVTAILMIGYTASSSNLYINQLLKAGYDHERNYEYRSALNKYQLILKVNSDHTEALWRCSKMMNYLGGLAPDRSSKQVSFLQAKDFALRAIQLEATCKEAHLNYVIALGMLSEIADSPREKLAQAKVIRKEADLLLQLDSLYAPAWFILGKWNYAIASLNWIERAACNLLFGGLPEEASLAEAVRCFDRAVELEPNQIRFHYSKATLHYHRGDYQTAIQSLNKAIALPMTEPDDDVRLEKCRLLLHEAKKNLRKT